MVSKPKTLNCQCITNKLLHNPNLEYMILEATEVKKLGPLTDLRVFTTFLNLAGAGSSQGSSYSISRESSDPVKSIRHSLT